MGELQDWLICLLTGTGWLCLAVRWICRKRALPEEEKFFPAEGAGESEKVWDNLTEKPGSVSRAFGETSLCFGQSALFSFEKPEKCR